MNLRCLIVVVAAWLALLPAPADAQFIEPEKVAKIKSAYLLNFMRFSSWPDEAFSTAQAALQLCVVGDDSLGHHLDLTMHGQNVAGRTINVSRPRLPVTSGNTPPTCHLLYLSADTLEQAPEVLRDYANRAALTVGETAEFARIGTMLALNLEGDRIIFYANPDAVNRAPIRLSSKIMQLARVVTTTARAAGL